MNHVLDASALLAYILAEPGGEAIADTNRLFVLSSVNLSEVLAKAADRAMAPNLVMRILRRLPIEHHGYDREDAVRSAALRPRTRHLGLSLGDRACLALAQRLSLPVLTSDRVWAKLQLGIDIRQIR